MQNVVPMHFLSKKGLSSCNPSTGLAKAVQNTFSQTKFLPEGMHYGDRPVEVPDDMKCIGTTFRMHGVDFLDRIYQCVIKMCWLISYALPYVPNRGSSQQHADRSLAFFIAHLRYFYCFSNRNFH